MGWNRPRRCVQDGTPIQAHTGNTRTADFEVRLLLLHHGCHNVKNAYGLIQVHNNRQHTRKAEIEPLSLRLFLVLTAVGYTRTHVRSRTLGHGHAHTRRSNFRGCHKKGNARSAAVVPWLVILEGFCVVLEKQQQSAKQKQNDILGVSMGLVGSGWAESDPAITCQLVLL